MRKCNNVERELRELFGQRQRNKPQSKAKKKKGGFGSTTFLIVCFTLGCGLGACPFIKPLSRDQRSAGTPLYYKEPVNADIVPISHPEETIDLLFFTGCAHQRRTQPKVTLRTGHLTEGVKIDPVKRI